MSKVTIENGALAQAAECAAVFRTARKHSLPYLPDLHSEDEDVRFLADQVFATDTVLVALNEARHVVAFIAFGEGWVNHLYVAPGWQGRGVGRELLERAKLQFPSLQLWTFERNAGALRFYEREGFRVLKHTDGSGNEEKEPDVLLRWEG
ncbi:MAG TPA: GNAT family N-acetyltransferase [Candidatus Acidoferrales bacterium]|nr:GNAT family N-acetyltransferase [Candidatus Acidoferrales bacterium]